MICPSRTRELIYPGMSSEDLLRKVDCGSSPARILDTELPFTQCIPEVLWDAPRSRKQGVRLHTLHSYNPFLSNSSHNVCRCFDRKEFTEIFADFTFPPSPTPRSTDVEFAQKYQSTEEWNLSKTSSIPIAPQLLYF